MHSLDGVVYEKIGEVLGQGTTNAQTDYTYLHLRANPGLNFYQLRQVDFDGAQELSDVIQVENNENNVVFGAVIYPNPGRLENLRINLTTVDAHTPIEVSIVDLSGKRHLSRTFSRSSVSQGLSSANDNLSPGLYFVEIKQGRNLIREKLIIE